MNEQENRSSESAPGRRKLLFAPWRIEYIMGPKDPECFFCAAAQLRADDEAGWQKRLLLYRDRRVLVVMNLYPYVGGHLLVAPHEHTSDYAGLPAETNQALWRTAQLCVRVLERRLKPDGFNLGMNLGRPAGAGVEDHLHLHVVPRWSGDINFLPVVADTHSVPVALEELWGNLRPDFAALGSAEA